jgi:mannose-6-phosphate isomerase
LAYTNVVKDKIYYVPSGTIHALLSGLVVFEIQQPSQTTFRLYDYEREKTNPSRRLTIKESIDNTIVPFKKPILNKKDNELLTTPYFSIKKIINKGKKTYQFNQTK